MQSRLLPVGIQRGSRGDHGRERKPSMNRALELAEIARCMIELYGENAAGLMERHARQRRSEGQLDDADFWTDVARVIRKLQSPD